MKTLILFLLTGLTLFCNAQKIEYKGGKDSLDKTIYKSLPFQLVEDTVDKYFNLILTIDRSGSIKELNVAAIADSSLIPYVISAVRRTDHKWINRSAKDVLVKISIYVLYEDGMGRSAKAPKLSSANYLDWNKSPIICLDPFVIRRWPAIQEHFSKPDSLVNPKAGTIK